MTDRIRRTARWVDDRLGIARAGRSALDKIFPDHWSFMIGELAMYAFAVLVLTGIYLTFFFEPSSREVVYNGSYAPLRGQHVSAAYRSALDISFKVRAGLVMRQTHHWAALVFVAAIVVHLMRVFFTGAFRRPREVNWMVGVTLLVLAMANGFFGYSLLDDLLSGTGVRVGYSIALSIPVAGPWLAFLFFGGRFPTDAMIPRFFVMHVLLLPALIIGVLTLHLGILWHQKHSQFPGPGRTEQNIEGSRLWPTYAIKSLALFGIVAAVLTAMGGLIQINPIWIYGPFRSSAVTSAVTSASQPDWYVGWMDGALRVMPPWEVRIGHFTIPNPFFPGVLLPGLTFAALYLWPFIDARWITGERERKVHNLLDRPRDVPIRTALGVAVLLFYTLLFVAAGNDVLAGVFNVSPESITNSFRVLIFVVPAVAFVVTYRVCRDLSRGGGRPTRGPVGYTVEQTSTGGFVAVDDGETHAPVP